MTDLDLSGLRRAVERLQNPTPEPPPHIAQPVILHNGDILILHTKTPLTDEEFDRLHQQFAPYKPDLRVTILEGDLELVAVYRADKAKEEPQGV